MALRCLFFLVLSNLAFVAMAQNNPTERKPLLAEDVTPAMAAAAPKPASSALPFWQASEKVSKPPVLCAYWALEKQQYTQPLNLIKGGSLDDLGDNPFSLERHHNPFSLEGRSMRSVEEQDFVKPWRDFFQTIFQTQASSRSYTPIWFFFVLLPSLSVFAFLLRGYRRQLLALFRAFFYEGALKQSARESVGNWYEADHLGLLLIYVLNLGSLLFFMQGQLAAHTSVQGFTLWLSSVAAVIGLAAWGQTKRVVLSQVFNLEQEQLHYNALIVNSYKVLAMVLFPMVVLLAYAPSPLSQGLAWFSLGFMGLVYVQRTFRALLSFSELIYLHKFHFLLYLCSVELAPMLILLKYLGFL